mmetsp:Transcript_76615/g.173284  ORF Transcript_76615/g.173284 Transcript_76615/m.173284 type:complete len:227 (-) Transcript_76615:788-1468(-)
MVCKRMKSREVFRGESLKQATDTAERLWEKEDVTEFLSDLETSVTIIAMEQRTKVVLKHKELREAEVQVRGKTGEALQAAGPDCEGNAGGIGHPKLRRKYQKFKGTETGSSELQFEEEKTADRRRWTDELCSWARDKYQNENWTELDERKLLDKLKSKADYEQLEGIKQMEVDMSTVMQARAELKVSKATGEGGLAAEVIKALPWSSFSGQKSVPQKNAPSGKRRH